MGGAAPIARIFRPKSTPAPRPAPMPTPTKAEVSQAASTTMGTTRLRGRGRTSTILTGAKGLGDTDLTVSKYTLLGG